jgi:hypothetical protein
LVAGDHSNCISSFNLLDPLMSVVFGSYGEHTTHKPWYLESKKSLGIHFWLFHKEAVLLLPKKFHVQLLRRSAEAFLVE